MRQKQHQNPCGGCPFTDKCEPGETGGSHPWVYVAQTYGPFWIPCHERIDFSDPEWRTKYGTAQCVGHAIMRSKLGLSGKMPGNLLEVDHEDFQDSRVFDSMTEFWAYHEQIPVAEAARYTSQEMVVHYLAAQLQQTTCDVRSVDEFSALVDGD